MKTTAEQWFRPGATRPQPVSMRRGTTPYNRTNAVRVDRQNPKWGTPYRTRNASPSERRRVIRLYGKLLYERVRNGVVTRQELADLCGMNLECWCAPLACHANPIADAAVAAAGTDTIWNAWLTEQTSLHQAA